MYIRIYKGHILKYRFESMGEYATVSVLDISFKGINKHKLSARFKTAQMIFELAYLNKVFPQHLDELIKEVAV